MLFEITQEEITAGGHTLDNCPVLRTIRRQTGNQKLYCTTLGLKKQRGGRVIYKWPTSVYQWILKYDSQQKVYPFTLEVPDSLLGLQKNGVTN